MALMSSIYEKALTVRKMLYQKGIKKTHRLPSRVISIGNITMGGTGKTPATIALAEEAVKRGFRPCVLTRGYGGEKKGYNFVSYGSGPLLNTREAGDEPVLMAQKLKGVPIVKGKKRFLSGLLCQDKVDLFILDDGFQHWSLYRDIDILLINSHYPFGRKNLLFPEGRLREPLESMERAQFIIITKSSDKDEYETIATIRKHNSRAPIYRAYHRPETVVNRNWQPSGVREIEGKRIYAFCGIADPKSFKDMLIALGADVVRFRAFRDHYPYRPKDIKCIKKESQDLEIITTEKDLVRLIPYSLPFQIKALSIHFMISDLFYDAVLAGKESI